MIKSKIDARERALELVASLHLHDRELIMDMANEFTEFLIGSADLPETFDDNAHLKELFDVAKREMEKINKRDYNYDLFMQSMHKEPVTVSADVPCKSDAE